MARKLITSFLLFVLASTLGCGEDEDRTPPRGAVRSGGPMGQTTTPATEASADPFAPPRQAPERRLMGPTEIRETRETEDEIPAERDYSAELRAGLGSPTSCGPLGVHTAHISIRFSAVVTENGVITRGSVSGPVPAETLACLQGRLQRVRLRGDIEGAPRTISTSIELEPVAAPTMEAAPPPTPAYGMGAQAIRGPEGRPIDATASRMIEAADSRMIEAADSQMIEATMAQTISGPTGIRIGQ